MTLQSVIEGHARRQRTLARRTAARLGQLWYAVDPARIAATWRDLLPGAVAALATSQATAAASAGTYVDDALEAQGVVADAAGRVSPAAFAGSSSDGRDLTTLLYRPVITTLMTIQAGAPVERAQAAGQLALDAIVRTQVADAGRAGESVAIAARPRVTSYVRMLSLPSCSRCILLAGRQYLWNAGFPRHPRCDCRHIPAAEDTADDLRTDPRQAFESLTEAEQDRAFTKAGAQAIRDGADVAQVVNARRGMETAGQSQTRVTEDGDVVNVRVRRQVTRTVAGRDEFTTTEATRRRGRAGVRLMPESIYRIAGDDRDEAIRLLKRFGYLT